MAVLSLVLLRWLTPATKVDDGHFRTGFDKKFLLLAGIVLFLLSMVNTLGFSFPLRGRRIAYT